VSGKLQQSPRTASRWSNRSKKQINEPLRRPLTAEHKKAAVSTFVVDQQSLKQGCGQARLELEQLTHRGARDLTDRDGR
jgi:hypothetical protein